MPCATIHMLTAGRVLGRWENDPSSAPFSVERRELRRSFLLGAMGPDMGFVPGVDRFVSELAHYVSTGDLTRALLEEAETPRQIAFAWGWATHHLTDVEIHPLVGRACGEHVHGDRSIRLNASADCETHVAMEVGLDLVFLASDSSIPSPSRVPLGGAGELDFMARALERTYGLFWDTRSLRRGHAKATARTARWPSILGLLGRGRRFEPGWRHGGAIPLFLGPLLTAARRVAPSGSSSAGFLRPLPPPGWLLDEVHGVAGRFAALFQHLVDGRLAALENRNLETGAHEDEPQKHPASARTLRTLRSLRGLQELRGHGAPERELQPADARA